MALKLIKGPTFITADYANGVWTPSSTAWASDDQGRLKLSTGNYLIHTPGGGAAYAAARSGGANASPTLFTGSAITGTHWTWYITEKTSDQPIIILKLE